jgi:hypothetical protein
LLVWLIAERDISSGKPSEDVADCATKQFGGFDLRFSTHGERGNARSCNLGHMALARKCPRHHVRLTGTHTTTEALS